MDIDCISACRNMKNYFKLLDNILKPELPFNRTPSLEYKCLLEEINWNSEAWNSCFTSIIVYREVTQRAAKIALEQLSLLQKLCDCLRFATIFFYVIVALSWFKQIFFYSFISYILNSMRVSILFSIYFSQTITFVVLLCCVV